MITALIPIVKFLIVAVLLVAMVMVLMGISHLSHVYEESDDAETADFKREVDEDANVVGIHSLFRCFLARDSRRSSSRR